MFLPCKNSLVIIKNIKIFVYQSTHSVFDIWLLPENNIFYQFISRHQSKEFNKKPDDYLP